MPRLRWDRTFETCICRSPQALLIAGYPPFWRFEDHLRSGQVPPAEADDLAEMLAEIIPSPEQVEAIPGCRSFGLRYGDEHRFRIDVLGGDPPRAILLTSLPADAPPPSNHGGERWYKDWRPAKVRYSNYFPWAHVMGSSLEYGWNTSVVAPGCPPFGWSRLGLHAANVPPIDNGAFQSAVTDMIDRQRAYSDEVDGYLRFSIRYATNDLFTGAVFGHHSPSLVLLIRHARSTHPAE